MVREKKSPVKQEQAGITADLDERLMRSPSIALGHMIGEQGNQHGIAEAAPTEQEDHKDDRAKQVKHKVNERGAFCVCGCTQGRKQRRDFRKGKGAGTQQRTFQCE